jgi:hypothetical protein
MISKIGVFLACKINFNGVERKMNQDDLDLFENDIKTLVMSLVDAFNAPKSRWFLHEQTETLYIELGGLDSRTEDEIENIAGPILDDIDLDFEEIILLPYSE